MSTEVDRKVVEMRFDHAQFERGAKEALKTLKELKDSLKDNKEIKSSLENIEKSMNNFSLKNISTAVHDGIGQFGALGVAGFTAMQRISNAAIDAAKNFATTVGELQAMKAGFQEYETQVNAVQTILANTQSKGTTIDDVNRSLDELNEYADRTIYNFTQMTDSIGKFTAAGVGLEDSVAAIKGISNLAAISGSDATQASRAMYNLSQALAMGKLQLMDWNSVVNAGMGGEIFQESLKETARVHGVMVDQIIEEEGSFRDSLQKGWITSEILTETLQKFTGDLSDEQLRSLGYTEEQIKAIAKLGEEANDAATRVKTFTQLFDTLNEARQSGWTQTWEIIVGDFYEARELLTSISTIFSDIINEQAQRRNSFLEAVLGPSAENVEAQTAETVAALNTSKEEIQRVVNEIWEGSWGNGEERWAALAEAGYDPVLIQSLVDLTETTEGNQIAWESLTDEQLLSVGASEEQIQAFRQLNSEIVQNTQNTEQADEKVSGRTLLVQSLQHVLETLTRIYRVIGEAWEEAFPPMAAETVYNLIASFEEFTAELIPKGEQLEQLKEGFRGLFDALGLVMDIAGGVGSAIGAIFDAIPKGSEENAFNFFEWFSNLGKSITDFRTKLKDDQTILKFVQDVGEGARVTFEVIQEIIESVKGWFSGEGFDIKPFEKLKSIIKNIADKIKGLKLPGISKIIEKIQGFLESKGIKLEWLDKIRETFENFTIGDLFGKLKEKLHEGLSAIGLADFNPMEALQSAYANVQNFFAGFGIDFTPVETVQGWIDGIKAWLFGEDGQGGIAEKGPIAFVMEKFDEFKQWLGEVTANFNPEEALKSVQEGATNIVTWITSTVTSIGESAPMQFIIDKFTDFKDWLVDVVTNFDPQATLSGIQTAVDNIIGWFTTAVTSIGESAPVQFVIDRFNDFKNWLGTILDGFDPETTLSSIQGAVDGIVGWFNTAVTSIGESAPIQFIINAFDTFKEWLGEIVSNFDPQATLSGIQTAVDGIVSWLTTAVTGIVESAPVQFVIDRFNDFKNWLGTITDGFDPETTLSGIQGAVDGIVGWFTTAVSSIGETEPIQFIIDKFNDFKDWLGEIVKDFAPEEALKTIQEGADDVVKWITTTVTGAGDGEPMKFIEDRFTDFKNWLGEIAPDIDIDGIIGTIRDKIDDVVSWFQTPTSGEGTSPLEFIKQKFTIFATWISGKVSQIDFQGIFDKITNAVGKVVEWFQTDNALLDKSPLEWIKEKFNDIKDWALDLISKIDFDEVFSKITGAIDKVVGWFRGDGGSKLTSSVSGGVGGGIGDQVDEFMNKVDGWTETAAGIDLTPVTTIKDGITTLSDSVKEAGDKLDGATSDEDSGVGGFFKTIRGWLDDLESGDYSSIIEKVSAFFGKLLELLPLILAAVESGKMARAFGDIGKGIGSIGEGLTKFGSGGPLVSVVGDTNSNNAENPLTTSEKFLKIAEALGILAVAIKLLSDLQPEQVASAAESMATAVASLLAALAGEKFLADPTGSKSLLAAAAAIAILVGVVKVITSGGITVGDALYASLIIGMLSLVSAAAIRLANGGGVKITGNNNAIGGLFGVGQASEFLTLSKYVQDMIDMVLLIKESGLSLADAIFGVAIISALELVASASVAISNYTSSGFDGIGTAIDFVAIGKCIDDLVGCVIKIRDSGITIGEAWSSVGMITVLGLLAAGLAALAGKLGGTFGLMGAVGMFAMGEAIKKLMEALKMFQELDGTKVKENFDAIFADFDALEFGESIGEFITGVVDGIIMGFAKKGPELLQIGADIATVILTGLNDAVDTIVTEASHFIQLFVDAIFEACGVKEDSPLKKFVDQFFTLFNALFGEGDLETAANQFVQRFIELIISFFKSNPILEAIWDGIAGLIELVGNMLGQQDFRLPRLHEFQLDAEGNVVVNFDENSTQAVLNGDAKLHLGDNKTLEIDASGGTLTAQLDGSEEVEIDPSQVRSLMKQGFHLKNADGWEFYLDQVRGGIVYVNPEGIENVQTYGEGTYWAIEDTEGYMLSGLNYTQEDLDSMFNQWYKYNFSDDKITQVKEGAEELANAMVEGETGTLEDAKDETKSAGSETLGEAPIEGGKEAADSHSPSKKTMQLGKDMVDGLTIGMKNNSQLPVFVMVSLIGSIINAVQGKQIYFYQAALDCVRGLTNGFQAGASSAIEAAKTMALDTLNAAKQTLGVASPSKEFAKIGMYSDQGLAQGFIKYIPDVVHAVNETGQTAIDTLYNAMVSPVNDLYDDFDLYPNITPIVDLHNIQNANQLLSRSFGITTSDLMEESRALKSQFDNSLYYEAYDDSGVIGAIMGLNDRLNQLDSSISNMSMVLDSGALVGQLTPRVDKQLGTIARRKARGV